MVDVELVVEEWRMAYGPWLESVENEWRRFGGCSGKDELVGQRRVQDLNKKRDAQNSPYTM